MASLAEMNQIDFFARIIMETARHDPVIRDALYRLPRIPIPADHYHCSCCGRIILEKGTTKLARCARRWLGAIVGITKATWKSLSHAAIKVHQLFSQLKPGHIDRVKARAHNIWLTSSFSDEAASETTALITESNEPSGSRSMARRRRPDHSIQANSWRSTGKPSGLRSTIGELVKTVEPVKSEQSSKLAGLSEKPTAVEQCSEKSSNAVESSGKSNNASESSEKTANVAQVVQPAPPASAVSSKGQKCLEEATNIADPKTLEQVSPNAAYTNQTYWGSVDDTPIKPRGKVKVRHQSVDHTILPSPSAPEVEQAKTARDTAQERIAVSPASRDTLSRLFTSDPKNKKMLHFDTIVAALDEAGLTAKRGGKCSGSAVTFKHRGGKGSIVFHCPHPEPKIEFHKQRTWGTRLQNKFGWELETFVERVGGS